MLNFFSNNIGAKLLALSLAIGLWLFVMSSESLVRDFPSAIQIQPQNVGKGLVAKLDVSEVHIRIATEHSSLKKLSSDSFQAFVDLSGLSKGTYADLPIKVTSKNSDVQIKSINPSKVNATLDPAVTKTVPVVVKIEGKAGEGLAPDEPVIEPEKVEVSGAKSDVDTILEATATIKLNSETQDVSKTVPLQGFNARGDEIPNLKFTPTDVKVTVPITKAGKSKTVGIKVKINGSPDSEYWISQVLPNPSTVNITSNDPSLLANTKYIETSEIDVEGISSEKNYKATLTLPQGVNLVDNIEEIQVTISVSSIDSSKEVLATINPIGLSPSLDLSSYGDTQIRVVVSGPTNILKSLASDKVLINLDLSSYKSPGTFTLDINRTSIVTPNGTTPIKYNPSAITITLKNK